MDARRSENLFRQKAIDSLSRQWDGRPVAIMPRPWLWLTALCVAFALGACSFAWSANYARKESVRGWLVSEQGIVRLTHGTFATVASIEHSAGEAVQRGDTIMYLSSEEKLGNGMSSSGEILDELRAELTRADEQEELLREQFTTDHAALDVQVRGIDSEINALAGQVREQDERNVRNTDKLGRLRAAYAKGAIAEVDLLRQQDELAAMHQSMGRLQQETNRLRRERQGLAAAQARLGIDLERDLSGLASLRSELRQRITRHEGQRLLAVQSPISGAVATLDVVAGSTIRPLQLLAAIVPEQSSLAADVYVPSRAVGLIRPGQTVRLHYDAFPHQQFGAATGRVQSVAGFVSLPGDTPAAFGLREAAYKVRINVDSEHVEDRQGSYALRPGMLLAAEIVLESRSIADWLLAPLKSRL